MAKILSRFDGSACFAPGLWSTLGSTLFPIWVCVWDRDKPAATMMLQNGVDIKTVSGMLGHYDAGFTLRTYSHTTNRQQAEAADMMGSLMAQSL